MLGALPGWVATQACVALMTSRAVMLLASFPAAVPWSLSLQPLPSWTERLTDWSVKLVLTAAPLGAVGRG